MAGDNGRGYTEAELEAALAAYRHASDLDSDFELPPVLVAAIERKHRKVVGAILEAAAQVREAAPEEAASA